MVGPSSRVDRTLCAPKRFERVMGRGGGACASVLGGPLDLRRAADEEPDGNLGRKLRGPHSTLFGWKVRRMDYLR